MPYYTKGDKQMQATDDTSAIVAEFEAERNAVEAAFVAVEVDTGTASAHATGDGSDHADVATNSAHVAGDGSDHANVATNDAHVAGDGSDHADVATNSAHVAISAANPHGVAPSMVVYTAGTAGDWAAAAPIDLQAAIDRLAAQLAIVSATPIP